MGIKYFYKYLTEKYSSCVSPSPGRVINHLAIDLNVIFHNSIRKTTGLDAPKRFLTPRPPKKVSNNILFDNICRDIEKVILEVKPTKSVILCIDGVAGFAKMFQQRQRRFRYATSKDKEIFDTCNISPGTEFMNNLSKVIDFFIRKKTNNELSHLKFIFSNEKVPGEGEHKIMNYIRLHGVKNESYCISSVDADLVMLCLATYLPHIYIHRPSFQTTYINVGLLADILISELYFEGCDTNRIIDDFICMCFLVGNDFLPNIPTLEIKTGAISCFMSVYGSICSKYGHFINKDLSLNINTFLQLITLLAEKEKEGLEENKDRIFPDPLLIESTTIFTTEEKQVYSFDLDKYKKLYYEKKLKGDINHICSKYIQGIKWIIQYYKKGIPDWTWFYPYYYSPFLSDMVKVIKDGFVFHPFDLTTTPIPPYLQLLYILPPQSAKLLPEPLTEIFKDEKDYPLKVEIDLDGKQYEWEGLVLLPFLNLKKISGLYYNYIRKVEKNKLKRNIKGKNFIYKKGKDIYNYTCYYGNISNCQVDVRDIEF